jgi:hypothetical protein
MRGTCSQRQWIFRIEQNVSVGKSRIHSNKEKINKIKDFIEKSYI